MLNRESDFGDTPQYSKMDGNRFETFVIELLDVHLRNQGKQLVAHTTDLYDCVAPYGFDDFPGPVLIEICTSLNSARFERILKGFGAFTGNASDSGVEVKPALLVITGESKRQVARFQILARSLSDLDESKIEIWPRERLQTLVRRYSVAADSISNDLLRLQVKNAKEQAAAWQQTRLGRIASLSERYSTGQFALFLGAGVSSSAGMPDWNTLLNSLFLAYLAKGTQDDDVAAERRIVKLVERMNDINKHSALVTARYIRKGISAGSEDKQAFTRAIREALYGLRRKDKPIDSELITILARLCMPRRSGAPVRSVVTYNFDDLFERQLEAKSIPHKCVYTEKANVDVDELPVFHVHGFIPEKTGPDSGSDDGTLVFAEEGYHQIYTDAYHWSNLVQLSALRDSTCLMVGLSMADPNLRRLLEIAKRGIEQRRHYAFMKRTSVDEFVHSKAKDADQIPLFDDLSEVSNFLEGHHGLTEVLMDELGVTVIWYENHDDIPKILENVGFPEPQKVL
jgi:hypothetical protein